MLNNNNITSVAAGGPFKPLAWPRTFGSFPQNIVQLPDDVLRPGPWRARVVTTAAKTLLISPFDQNKGPFPLAKKQHQEFPNTLGRPDHPPHASLQKKPAPEISASAILNCRGSAHSTSTPYRWGADAQEAEGSGQSPGFWDRPDGLTNHPRRAALRLPRRARGMRVREPFFSGDWGKIAFAPQWGPDANYPSEEPLKTAFTLTNLFRFIMVRVQKQRMLSVSIKEPNFFYN
ncbi:uncharacterized protein LOC119594831 [Penaeus monodon]|uniref:uncharacterized protein LOC119594831 n=1 Tax=Penaeus monodon TaxID=6687 RepID=UPI0018A76B60|nr:uncharacterized protein LOC119594831 [Penaeus monodon]